MPVLSGLASAGPMRRFLLALLVYCAIAFTLTAPTLLGLASIMPEAYLDRDNLYRPAEKRATLRPFEDPAPVVIELGRERAVASGAQQGRLDTWNPWSGAGAPLWAEQGSPFFPTKFIHYAHPHHVTFMLALAARLVVAALGMFYLALALGLKLLPALFTGAVLEYSGILSAFLPYSNSSSAYLLPWALLGAHKLWSAGGRSAVVASALALGFTLLGGHPSYNLLVCLAFAAWFLGEWARRRPPLRQLARVAGLASAACALAFLVAAVSLFPFLELLWHGYSYKNIEAAEEIWRERLGWTRDAFGPALLLPSLITAARDIMKYTQWPWAGGASISLVGLLLAVAGARKLREHWGLILVGVLGVGLILAPVGLHWLHELPGVRFILPWYCYPLIVVPLCVAAGYGVQSLEQVARPTLLLVSLGVVLLSLLILAGALAAQYEAAASAQSGAVISNFYTNVLNEDLDPLRKWKTYISLAAALAAVVGYLLLCRRNLKLAAVLLAVLALAEAAVVRIPTIPFERSVPLRSGPPEATKRLQDLMGRSWRFTAEPPFHVGNPNSSVLFELRDLRSFSAVAVGRHVRFLDLAGLQDEDPWKYPQWQYPRLMKVPVLSLAAVKYVVFSRSHRDADGIPPGLRELEKVGQVVILENPQALPRFRIVRDVIAVDGEQQAYDALQRLIASSSATVPEWTHRTVIEGIDADEARRVRDEPPPVPGSDTIRVVSEPDPQTIVLEANLAAPGYVIVADTYYPGWRATIDGAPAIIHPANVMFRAVHVSAGRHTIVMKYQSTWLRTGMTLTALGLLIVAALLVRGRLRLRKPV